MNTAGVGVTIYKDRKCVYENASPLNGENNLSALIGRLRDVQSSTNDFLTTLVEDKNGVNVQNQSQGSDSDSDSTEEADASPKKCKLTD
ncbi:hypothetical protein KM043_001887 [Ampulex compressa]|nr:hypothetical protein KM043_001887 [Ampulex compressa]